MRIRKLITGLLVLLTSPMTSAPTWRKNIMIQMTTNVTQFASNMAAEDWIIARTPKNAAIP
ncbi:hypothetical protein D3C74_430170 [compost metagenome]